MPRSDWPAVATLSPIAIYSGEFGRPQAERLLWRAGFGPTPGQAAVVAGKGLRDAVLALTRPEGAARLDGPEPSDGRGGAVRPRDFFAHDVLWWLDRMVRSDQPLVERMTLVWHDWFATSNSSVSAQGLMLDQNELFRRSAFGSFKDLVHGVTMDTAMMRFLNILESRNTAPNENYARELMELFTLGADRGAYTEQDVREMARAFTGWTNYYDSALGKHVPRFDVRRHDRGVKTVFGRSGPFGWREACDLCLENELHASFVVSKLWSYFIATPPSLGDREALERVYLDSGYQIRPLLEAILLHPDLYAGEEMVKPPVVFAAGLLRATERSVDTTGWSHTLGAMQQRPFFPPDVCGWDDSRWLDSSTMRGRWSAVSTVIGPLNYGGAAAASYDPSETPETALQRAREFWGDPPLSADTVAALLAFAESTHPSGPGLTAWHRSAYRAQRQNALRMLVAISPDAQLS